MKKASHGKNWLHRHFIFLLLAAYGLAAVIPRPGLWLKSLSWGELPVLGEPVTSSLLMLSILLFTAGFLVDERHLSNLRQRPLLPMASLLIKGFLAVFWIGMLLLARRLETEELWAIMFASFAVVSIMPAANASTAWAQQGHANLALSLGIVLLSTLLIPLIIPVVGWITSQILTGPPSTEFTASMGSLNVRFIITWILLPISLGVSAQYALKQTWLIRFRTHARLLNALNLLLLNYMHGASFIPQAMNPFRPTLLGILMAGALGSCLLAFAAGACIGQWRAAPRPDRMAVTYGVGMNNNGMALILVSQFMGEAGWMGLTIALCTLGQHLMAAGTHHWNALMSTRNPEDAGEVEASCSLDSESRTRTIPGEAKPSSSIP
ncbi:MAG: hypothetical protein P8L18_13660 [Verrucomicrobiota bacterium]|nr:hypothetical protein [Verrucomicrobiota bacterium]